MRLHFIVCAGVLCLFAARPAQAEAPPARTDQLGDALPAQARFRLGTLRFWHRDGVEALAFSPNGALVAAGGGCDELRIWETATGKEVFHSSDGGNARALAFAPDGKLLAVGGGAQDDTLCVLEMPGGKVVHQVELGHGGIRDLLFSVDGQTLISGGMDGRICCWDVASARQTRNMAAHEKEILSLALSPDGKKVLTGSRDHTARLWELATGKELGRFPCADNVNSVAFHPDGAAVALGSDDKKIHLWNIAAGKKMREMEAHGTWILAVAFSPDGKTLASVHCDLKFALNADGKPETVHLDVPTVILWNPATGKQVSSYGRQGATIHRIRFSPDGKLLATGGSKLRIWATATGQEVPALPGHQRQVCSIAVSPDGRTLASRSTDKTVRIWDLSARKEIHRYPLADRSISGVSLSPDGKTMIWSDAQSLRLADLDTGRTLPAIKHAAINPAFSNDGRWLAAVDDKNVFLFDFVRRRLVREIKVDSGWFMGMAIAPAGKFLATTHYEGMALLLDPATGKVIRRLAGHRGWCSSVAFSPDGLLLATGGNDGTVRLWAIPSGKAVGELEAKAQTLAVAFSPDGRMVAAGQSGEESLVQVWEVASLCERLRFSGHQSMVECLTFSPDGKLLFTGSDDTTILAWDVFAADVAPARSADALAKAWNDLGSTDATRAFVSVRAMIAAPGEATAFLAQRLRPVPSVDARRLGRLLDDLDSQQFEAREKAREELEQLEEVARAALKGVIEKGRPSLEQRTRIERLLDQLDSRSSPDYRRLCRAVEILEHIASSESRRLLESLASGAPEARTTLEARAAINRLEARKQQ